MIYRYSMLMYSSGAKISLFFVFDSDNIIRRTYGHFNISQQRTYVFNNIKIYNIK